MRVPVVVVRYSLHAVGSGIFIAALLSLPANAQNPVAAQVARDEVPAAVIPTKRSNTPQVRERMHDSAQWDAIKDHLPDPATATPEALEMQADILRARRFPEDARDYYKYAIARGGKQPILFNKLGMTELEMKNVDLAKAYFQRAVKLNRKDPAAWNNLGAVEFLDGDEMSALNDYKHAIKLAKGQAVFHANLATAYFMRRDYKSAQREIATAMKLDPMVYEQQATTGGLAAHVLSSGDKARLAFELAKLYAQRGATDMMMHSLAVASESGMDLQREMRKDPILMKYVADPRVVTIVLNAEALGIGKGSTMGATAMAPPLPPTTSAPEPSAP